MKRGRPRHGDILTPREWEVLALMEEGLANEQIASRLGISYGGAKYHVAEILSKLSVHRREDAVAWARSSRAQPRATPLLGWLFPRIPTSSWAKLALGATVVSAFGLAAFFLLGLPGREGSRALPSPAGLAVDGVAAESFLTSIPRLQPPDPGQVIYRRTEVYERYGPKAPQIAAASGDPFETYVIESWLEVGPNNTIARAYTRQLDESGRPYKVSTSLDGVNRQWDPNTGRIILEERIPMTSALAEPDFAGYLDMLAHGWSSVLSQTDSELVVEATYDRVYFEWMFKQHPVPGPISIEQRIAAALQRNECGAGCMSRPFFGDLNAEALITRTTIRNDGRILLEERYIVTSGEDQILVGSWRQTHYDLIEAIPPEILALAP